MERIEWQVPLHLDESPRLLFLDMGQLSVLLLALGLGIALNAMLIGMAIGLVLARIQGALAAGRHPRFLMHVAYWHLPGWVLSLRRSPPSCLRLFVG